MEAIESVESRAALDLGEKWCDEFLTFKLGEEEYAIDILKVQEIRGFERPTRIANSQHYVLGVVNLRGVIVPIIDLRLKCGFHDSQYTETTVVIILNVGERVAGVVVDSVSDVLELKREQISEAPDMSTGIDSSYIVGLGTVDTRMLILIDIERMIGTDELGSMH
ncbi:MAG: chemotaxis protein CheW [Burkholderiaceae bacterium]